MTYEDIFLEAVEQMDSAIGHTGAGIQRSSYG